MGARHVVIIGGGLAGLSAGCYARASGFETTIVEHGAALGGVCTAWQRGPYQIDGCIQWLTGGPFEQLYRELEITPTVALRPLTELATYRNARDGTEVRVTRQLDSFARAMRELAPEDAAEIELLLGTARKLAALNPAIDRPGELAPLRSSLVEIWSARHLGRAFLNYGKPVSRYAAEHLASVPLRRLLNLLLPQDAPVLFLCLMLGYLERGYLSRPVGGSGHFRDALVRSYQRRRGAVELGATVEEILVERDRARGVRLSDGRVLAADHVISTSSIPETLLCLLGGRYGLTQHADKLEHSSMHGPLLLVSLGVAHAMAGVPPTLRLDQVRPFYVGGRASEQLSLRVFNDEPSFAPPGHTVVQAMLTTDYEYWATRGTGYQSARDEVGESVVAAIERALPGIAAAQEMLDVSTPLTYWHRARSWRGAHEGLWPTRDGVFARADKRVRGLGDFYLAGQWIEPGGGVPVALLSGRHAVQLLCSDLQHPFVTRDGLQLTPP